LSFPIERARAHAWPPLIAAARKKRLPLWPNPFKATFTSYRKVLQL
jgi:hypothetical protein